MAIDDIPSPEMVAQRLGIPPEALRCTMTQIHYQSPDLSWSHVERGPDRLGEVAVLAGRLLEALSDDREYLRLACLAVDDAVTGAGALLEEAGDRERMAEAVSEDVWGLVEAIEKLRELAERAHRRRPAGGPPLAKWMYNAAELVRDLCERHGVSFSAGFDRQPTVSPRSDGAQLLTAVIQSIDPKVPIWTCRTLARRAVQHKRRPAPNGT
jgi:hypothetical protein